MNLGCGNLGQEGWINIDRTTDSGIYYHDLRNLLPLESGCARHIHCEHFLEHLTYAYAKKLLKECYRMLEDGGTLRLIVPDAEKYLSAYCENNEEFFDQLKHLGGTAEAYKTKMEIINQMFRMDNDHNFAWDYATLELALKEAGFSTVQRSAKGETGAEYNIDGDDWWRTLESVYVNATK